MMSNKIVIAGDVMLDKYIDGAVERISPEAPVQVLLMESTTNVLGGAANVAHNLVNLGNQVLLLGEIGADADGEAISKLCETKNIVSFFHKDENSITSCKIRYVSNSHQLLRVDRENRNKSSSFNLEEYLSHILNDISVLVLSDYNKGFLNNIEDVISLSRQHGIISIVDPKSHDWLKYRGADLITPNEKEFNTACKHYDLNGELEENVCLLLERFDIRQILITQGSKGAILYDGDKFVKINAIKSHVYDVTGAGDTVIASLAHCIAKGMSTAQAAKFASVAAGISVSHFGTYAPTLTEIEKKYISLGDIDTELQIIIYETGVQIPDIIQRSKNIVFSNGCFDILHEGHIKLLKECRRLSDCVVVGLNSDESIKTLKGTSRPINEQMVRARQLLALGFVDFVFIFNDSTPRSLIQAILPNTIVKGGDYEAESVVGSDIISEYNGNIIIYDYIEDVSTTKIITKILEKNK